MDSHDDTPIYVRDLGGINDDPKTPEGSTFIQFESYMFIFLAICWIIGHFV